MKLAALKLMRAAGAFSLFRSFNRRRALILTYHRFSLKPDDDATSARALAEQLAYLKTHYRVVTLSELTEAMSGSGALPTRMAAITIDDGYRDAYEIAYPLLRRFELPATLYVVTDFIERRIWLWTDKMRYLTSQTKAQNLTLKLNGNSLEMTLGDESSRRLAASRVNSILKRLDDEAKEEELKRVAKAMGVRLPETPPDEFAAINWQQAREMDANGVEIGSHTVTHPILTNVDDQRLRRELSESRAGLEARLGRRVEHFCYPNGNYDERVRSLVENSGYASAVTTESGLVDSGDERFTLRRVHTEPDMPHFVQSTSGFEAAKDRLRRIRHRGGPVHAAPGGARNSAEEFEPVI